LVAVGPPTDSIAMDFDPTTLVLFALRRLGSECWVGSVYWIVQRLSSLPLPHGGLRRRSMWLNHYARILIRLPSWWLGAFGKKGIAGYSTAQLFNLLPWHSRLSKSRMCQVWQVTGLLGACCTPVA
ncbi:hypothetical protein BAE44_0020193, partial [Dichanthelium oligosanthes]